MVGGGSGEEAYFLMIRYERNALLIFRQPDKKQPNGEIELYWKGKYI
jgi:hypothetical protein